MSDMTCPYDTSGELPLEIRPRAGDPASRSQDALCQWLKANAELVQEWLTRHGALRFRGFGFETPDEFERLARDRAGARERYLGTSPRDSLTDYVSTRASCPTSIRFRSTAR
jgi:hypothetical protein